MGPLRPVTKRQAVSSDSEASLQAALQPTGDGVLLRVKVVPGGRRDAIVGLLGDRLKIAVSAPPEKGKANAAVCQLLAGHVGVPVSAVDVVAGHTTPRKTIQIKGATVAAVAEQLSR